MVAGDIISATFASGTQTFQPAAGVEIMIMFVGGSTGNSGSLGGSQVGLTDGVNAGLFHHNMGARAISTSADRSYGYAAVNNSGGNLKIGITNTIYLTMIASGNASYSGIQIK
tara:strand:+ start:226 stop:564 length:339 start_codon:yes stop_codon:yes gene_type:complete